jgi:hypothetical protein
LADVCNSTFIYGIDEGCVSDGALALGLA